MESMTDSYQPCRAAITRANKRRPTRVGPFATLALATLGLAPVAWAQPTFQITSIPLLPAALSSHAQAVNNLGQVVGWQRFAGANNVKAFLFDSATGTLTDLGQINGLGAGGDTCGPKSINDAGQIVGTFTHLPSGRPHAFYWNGAGMIDITTPPASPGPFSGEARGITPGGFIVGLNDLACGSPSAFSRGAFWNFPADTAHVGDIVGQCGSSYPMLAVNASNVMAGRQFIQVSGFTWARPTVTTLPGTQVMLPTYDGSFNGHGTAWDINSAGVTCGNSEDRNVGTSHACYWIGTTIHVIHGLTANDLFDDARGINDAGDIVGTSHNGAFRAVIWPGLSPTAINLQSQLTNSTSLTLGDALDISNTGFIAANADTAGSSARGVLLSPCTPAFVTSPAPITMGPGGTAVFTASAVGAGPPTIAWSKGGVPLSNGLAPGGSIISGATTATLTITGITSADAGSYTATATTPCGTATSTPASLALCSADFDHDGTADFFDYDAYVNCFEGFGCPPGTTADFDGDGTVDFFDYDAFVLAFESGC